MLIAVCDDEKEILEKIKEYLLCAMQNYPIGKHEIHLFWNMEDFIYQIEQNEPYRIVFLDIKMGEYNGIQIAEKLKEKQPTSLIIFITSYHQYVYDVFRAHPFDFIRKPLCQKDIQYTFCNALKQCDDSPVLEYSFNGRVYCIYLRDIYYITSRKREILVRHKFGESRFYEKLTKIEEILNKKSYNFLRISQSVIINIRYMEELGFQMVKLGIDGKVEEFNISRKYQQQVRTTYLNYMTDKMKGLE
ncbi:MAG: response regulator transcription factor [Lachnospiraceae bacterium]|nr:response regulator transcription factor [Lachnospiraceae bacterium]MCI8826230.1 response regulator transcription factor [Lachnospiraceae bacterium]